MILFNNSNNQESVGVTRQDENSSAFWPLTKLPSNTPKVLQVLVWLSGNGMTHINKVTLY